MLKTANKTNYFTYKREEKQNPNVGFMSFQHFEGEEIYSDCDVEVRVEDGTLYCKPEDNWRAVAVYLK